jgi:ubiquinone/menaquinone biosynthesis C-methylase UbiE
MARNVQMRELLIGIEGLALLRHLYDGTDADALNRLVEVRRLLDEDTFGASEPTSEADAREGYESWSWSYDEPGNPIIALEESELWSLIEDLAPSRALDAACGTGRHARRLVELGHNVTGVDFTPAMLDRARAAVPEAVFHEADLMHIPAEDGEFSLVVCGLALAHVSDLGAAVGELARVLATGGHLVVSVLHPFQALLGWQAPFEDESGARRFVREHTHSHADYLDAFTHARLLVRRCVEPRLSPMEVSTKRRAFLHIPDATVAAYVGLPAVLIWSAEKIPAAADSGSQTPVP